MPIKVVGAPAARVVNAEPAEVATEAPVVTVQPPPLVDDFSAVVTRAQGPALNQPSVPRFDVPVTYGTDPNDVLFIDGVDARDPVQGQLGDCYLIATLSAYAVSKPDVLRNAITANADGTFTVRLFRKELVSHGPRNPSATVHFVPHEVRIDSQLPRLSAGFHVFARGQVPQELWAPLIEKAYAQLHGGYGKIEGDFPSRVMEALTGQSATTRLNLFFTTNGTFERIDKALSRGKPVTASTIKPDLPGLVPTHAYTVLRSGEENGQRFIELRNPWGFGEPTRDAQDDGVFRLTPEEFKRNFPALYIDD